MCGGAGTRLWPMSRQSRPKQFLALTSEQTLFQETALRLTGPGFAPPIVIAGRDHAAIVEQQLWDIGIVALAIVIEPMPRNTAAVAAVAAQIACEVAPEALVLLTPADHHVEDALAFRRAVVEGVEAAQQGFIVTFGVKPTEPHTGFGYIERGAALGPQVFRIRQFHEKPARDAAQGYLDGGAHFWNAGIFLFAPSAMRAAFAEHAPTILNNAAAALAEADVDGARRTLNESKFAACPSDSIDFAIMEKTAQAALVAPIDVGWSDVGSWSALNAIEDSRVLALESVGTIVRTDGPFVGVIGAENLIVIATADAVLVAHKDRAQDVKRIVDELKARGRSDLL